MCAAITGSGCTMTGTSGRNPNTKMLIIAKGTGGAAGVRQQHGFESERLLAVRALAPAIYLGRGFSPLMANM